MTEGATPHLYKANKDQRMGAAYYQLLAGWKKLGGKLFIPFSAPRPSTWHGSWGVKEHIAEQPAQAPKYRTLLGFSNGNPCWWQNCAAGNVVHNKKPQRIPLHLISGRKSLFEARYITIPKQAVGERKLHQSQANLIGNIIQGTIENPRDLTARWRANWDDRNLNIWVGIVDEKHVKDSKDYWQDDSIEIYIDADASRGGSYDKYNDFHLGFNLGSNKISYGGTTPKDKLNTIKFNTRKIATGYQLEISIPWTTLNIFPKSEQTIGFDVQINDDDNGNLRDAKISWNAKVDEAWKNPEVFGQLILKDDSQNFANNSRGKNDRPIDKSAFSYQ